MKPRAEQDGEPSMKPQAEQGGEPLMLLQARYGSRLPVPSGMREYGLRR